MTLDDLFVFARAVAAVTFGLAALAKARDLDGFHRTITAFGVAGDRRARLLVPTVLVAEVLAVAAVAAPPPVAAAGLVLATAILATYTAILAAARAHGAVLGCNCFGRSARRLSWYDVARNVLLLAATGAGAGAAAAGAGTPPAGTAGLAVAAGVVATVLVVNLAEIVETLRAPLPLESAEDVA